MKKLPQVSLVGSGPGDPELITVRGRQRLESAEVVIYDDLAGDDLLVYCRRDCERIYVGKRCGTFTLPQEEIIGLMIARAREGRRVVRLKGGDPFIFGRGGEELAALLQADISCEVIPGITAATAAAAAAGVPLTHRACSSAVVFLTGHEHPGKPESAVDWAAYARLRATLCVYMGARRLGGIFRELVGAGMAADTPVAIVMRASRPDQRIEFSTLAGLSAGDAPAVQAPALAIIGEVARQPAQVLELAGHACGI